MASNIVKQIHSASRLVNTSLRAARAATAANNAWSANQAQINRNWQERLANTAHQREVLDLQRAGLNPVLSVNGSGAAVGSGTAPMADSSYADTLGSLASSALQAVSSMSNTLNNNTTALKNVSKQVAAQRYAAEQSASAMVASASISAAASKEVARINSRAKQIVQRLANKQATKTEKIRAISQVMNLYASLRTSSLRDSITDPVASTWFTFSQMLPTGQSSFDYINKEYEYLWDQLLKSFG